MRRREFTTLLGGAIAAWPLAGRAQQQGRTYRIGFLVPFARDTPGLAAFFDELGRNEFIEGQNLTVVPGSFGVRVEQMAEVAMALVKAAPDAISTAPDVYTRTIQMATRTIPIIAVSGDMVGGGLVASLARPEGNTTGISMFAPELDGKRQDLLIDALPKVRKIAAMADPAMSQTTPQHLKELRNAAQARNVELSIFTVANPKEIVPAINAAKAAGMEALNFLATPMFVANRQIVIQYVAEAALPAIYQWPEIADDGGFMAYGARIAEIYRQAARLCVRVLRGANPSAVPVEQPTKFELVMNLKTAKTLGLTVPQNLLVTADEVIE